MGIIKWTLAGVGGLAVAALIVFGALGLGGAAQADDSTAPARPSAYETALAQQLGISIDQLQAAQTVARNSAIDAQVAAGNLTPDQAAKLKSMDPSQVRRGLIRRAVHGVRKGVADIFNSAAQTIGISKAQLKTELKSGQSLAQVAGAHGVSRDQLKAGITSSITAQVNNAEANGKLTKQQGDRILSGLSAHLDKIIDHTRPNHQ